MEEEEKEKDIRQLQTPFTRYMRRRQENVSDIFSSSACPKEQEQSRPRVWMKLHKEKDPNHKLEEREGKYCAIVPLTDVYALVTGQINQIGQRTKKKQRKRKKRYNL